MATVTSPYGNGPAALQPKPEPMPDVGGVGNIVAPPEAAAQPVQDLDSLFAEIDAMGAEPQSAAAPDEGMSQQPMPEGLDSIMEQIREAPTRLRNAFTVTTPESLEVLKQSGMFDDVRRKGDVLQVKRKGRKGWEDFDRDKWELVGDALDFARDGVEALVENSARGLGMASGTLAAPGAGTLTGGAVAGAGGAVLAKNAGDIIAQDFLKIPRDPNRSMTYENALAASFGAGFGLLGSKLARNAAARKAVQTEAQKTFEFAADQAKSAMDDIAEVKNSGIVLGENGNFKLDPMQLVGGGNIPELDATAKELSTEQSFRNFRRQVGDSIVGAYDSVARALGAQAGNAAAIADDFTLSAKDVRQVEGKLIGSFRKLADAKLAGKPQLSPQFMQTLAVMKQEMPRDVSDFALSAGISEQQARQMQHMINGLANRIGDSGGQMTVDEMQQIYSMLTKTIDANMNSARGRPVAVKLIDLKNAIRDDWTETMGLVLPESYQQMYAASKARYKTIMDSTSQLGKLLETENISRNELISRLFETKGSYKFAQSAKALINETNPKLWNQLSGEYFDKLRKDATDQVTGSVNWGSMSKKWSNLDERLQTELLNNVGIPREGMDALLSLGTRVQGAEFPAIAKDPQLKVVKSALRQVFTWWGGGAVAKGGAAGSLLDGLGKDQAVAKWLKDGGLEEILKEMPGMKPGKVQALRDWVGNWKPTQYARRQAQTSNRRRAEENQ